MHWPGGETSSYSYLWLRDNARDEASFDSRSNQRRVFTASLDPDIRPDEISAAPGGEAVNIQWPDSEAPTAYEADFLYDFRQSKATTTPAYKTWDGSITPERFELAELGATGQAASEEYVAFLAAMQRDGFALVEDCPTTEESVEQLAAAVGYVRNSIFGGVWSFEADAAMDDSAYSNESLRPHTDGTYTLDPPGVQILLCMAKNGTGGESILVDGFRVAEQVRSEQPDVFKHLSDLTITGSYVGDGEHLSAHHPVFRSDGDTLVQVCFNNYDRAPMKLPEDKMRLLYEGIRVVDNLFNAEAMQWRYTLQPGEAIVFDNWRLLHGRT